MADKIKVLTKRPGCIPRSVWVTNSLENLQNHVAGPIETVTLGEDLVVICNEEGRIHGMPHNCVIGGVDFCGNIIIAGAAEDEFSDIPFEVKEMKLLFPQLWRV